MKKRIILLGATGSIGKQTLAVLRSYPEDYELVAFAVNTNIEQALAIIKEFQVKYVCVFDVQAAKELRKQTQADISDGMAGLLELMQMDADLVLNALVGSIGVLPTLEALKNDKDVALANKETLVMAGDVVMEAEQKSKGTLLPVDSEHAAIFQCLEQNYQTELKQLIITASGGSLRDMSNEEKRHATVEQVLAHPNWEMGAKITVDSATMMNKGFEVIEAHHLFKVGYDQIHTVVHRESRIHSMAEYVDGSILAHLGVTDMRIPIQYALTYPTRKPLFPTTAFDWSKPFSLQFEPMDFQKFPMLLFAYEAGKIGGTMPTVLNAANEIAVAAFLKKQIAFYQIEIIIQQMMEQHNPIHMPGLSELLAVDKNTRIETHLFMKEHIL